MRHSGCRLQAAGCRLQPASGCQCFAPRHIAGGVARWFGLRPDSACSLAPAGCGLLTRRSAALMAARVETLAPVSDNGERARATSRHHRLGRDRRCPRARGRRHWRPAGSLGQRALLVGGGCQPPWPRRRQSATSPGVEVDGVPRDRQHVIDARRGGGFLVQAAVDVNRPHVEAVRAQARSESLELRFCATSGIPATVR
jgi:hypothetical protein